MSDKNLQSDHWRGQPAYEPIVRKIKQLMPETHRPYVDETACFAWLWEMGDEECDQVQCGLRSYCRQAWQMAQVQKGSNAKEVTYTEVLSSDLAAVSRKRPLKRRKVPRNKYKGLEKYNRKGYQAKGRLVDDLASVFRGELGLDAHDNGKKWFRSDAIDAPLALKVTASYHALIVKGVIVARLWTNTSRRASIDVVPELVAALRKLADELGPELTEPKRVSDKVLMKVRPCTHRVSAFTPSAIEAVVAIIADKFRLKELRGENG